MIQKTKVLTREDETPIRQTLEILHSGHLAEVRAIKHRTIWSGYFDDYGKAAKAVVSLDQEHQPDGIYTNLQELHPGLIARAPNRFVMNPAHTTKDRDVIGWRWALIDFDPVRPSGISSTDDELNAARDVAENVRERELADVGGFLACSSNGWHLVVACSGCAKSSIARLAAAYSCERVSIDKSTWEPSQITKLYGSYSRKGYEVENRIWRKSYIDRTYLPE